MRISVVGPSYPFRGGIAHYTSLLCRNLAARHEVNLLSMKRQYPSLLFPGRTQIDTSNVQIKVDGAERIVDSMNPLSWAGTARQIRAWDSDIALIQWWHPFFAPAFGTIAALIRRHCPVLFLCHNVLPHEKAGPTSHLARMALRYGSGYIVHSEEDMNDLKKLVPGAVVRKAHHPTYEVFNLNGIDRVQARSGLGVDGKVILFFGLVRQYKGLKHLIDAMPAVKAELADVTLLVVGEFYDDKAQYISQIKQLGLEDAVLIHDQYVPNEEVGKYFAATDVVVLPYVSATQSGIVQIAFGFDRPVITTNVGGLPEAVKDGETGIIVPPADPDALSGAVIDYFKEEKGHTMAGNITKARSDFSWDRMVETIESLAAEVRGC